CGSFSQITDQANALEERLGNSASNCSVKPDESVINGLISCLESSAPREALDRSTVDLHLSAMYGEIAQCYRSGLGQRTPGEKSWDYVVASTKDDPTNPDAWISYAGAIAGIKS